MSLLLPARGIWFAVLHRVVLGAGQARRTTASRAAATQAMASADASGYGSDEEVYATARAVDDADGYDGAEIAEAVDKKKIEPLPALDHDNMEYDYFAKNFYEEAPALKSQTFVEARFPPSFLFKVPHVPLVDACFNGDHAGLFSRLTYVGFAGVDGEHEGTAGDQGVWL